MEKKVDIKDRVIDLASKGMIDQLFVYANHITDPKESANFMVAVSLNVIANVYLNVSKHPENNILRDIKKWFKNYNIHLKNKKEKMN